MFAIPSIARFARLAAASLTGMLLLGASLPLANGSELPTLGEDSYFNIARETQLGYSVYRRLMERGLIETHPLLDRYINDLGFRLLAGLDKRLRDYRFFIVRDNAVNAFALPGGYIGVNRGLILRARTQHQLASVLAHEIAHVRLRHGMQMMEKASQVNTKALLTALAGLLLGSVDSEVGAAMVYGGAAGSQQEMVNFTRENEYEADRIGIELLHNAQFDARGMVEFFGIMAQLSGSGGIEYLRTHPLNENRIAEAANRAERMSRGSNQVDDFTLFKDFLYYTSSDHMRERGSEYLRALGLMRDGERQQADARLAALYQRDPENIWYSIAYAENLENLRRPQEAQQVYRNLLDIFPGDYVLSMGLMQLLQKSGDHQAALSIARDLENQFPSDKQVYFELSEIYRALNRPSMRLMAEAEFHRLSGNPRQAIRLYDQVLESADVDIATESKAREKRLLLLERL